LLEKYTKTEVLDDFKCDKCSILRTLENAEAKMANMAVDSGALAADVVAQLDATANRHLFDNPPKPIEEKPLDFLGHDIEFEESLLSESIDISMTDLTQEHLTTASKAVPDMNPVKLQAEEHQPSSKNPISKKLSASKKRKKKKKKITTTALPTKAAEILKNNTLLERSIEELKTAISLENYDVKLVKCVANYSRKG
jgi:hypothetical protein